VPPDEGLPLLPGLLSSEGLVVGRPELEVLFPGRFVFDGLLLSGLFGCDGRTV
jgi:hypothetical protein